MTVWISEQRLNPDAGPGLLLRIRRNHGLRCSVRRCNALLKGAMASAMAWLPEARPVALEELKGVRRILIVRPNFRLGNTLISACLIPSIRARFPEARIDFLGTDKTAPLLEHLGLGEIEVMSRAHLYRWDRLVALIRRLRHARYDVVIDAGRGSLTSALFALISAGRVRVGQDRGRLRRFLHVRLGVLRGPYVYDGWRVFADAFHPDALPLPYYRVSEAERVEALRWLEANELAPGGLPLPFLAVFVGGHLNKRVPAPFWREFLRQLSGNGVRILLFDGPEEGDLVAQLARLELPGVVAAPVQSIRKTAALCERAALVASPDTGTVHLAAALRRPVVSILQVELSRKYVPHGPCDLVLMRPSPEDAVDAVLAQLHRLSQVGVPEPALQP